MTDKNLRPAFHITGRKGWINDPNGLVKFKGEYHVFYQYYSSNVYWGPMHWGHVKSRDLLNWQRLPVALKPDEQDDGCFSGTAIVWQDKLWLMYTSYKEIDGKDNVLQLQALASSDDGVHFIKHGIVIGEKELPADYFPCDFRDPKVLRQGDTFYCLVAARKSGGRGRILLFSSPDLFNWKFEREVLDGDCGGIMIECPDYNDKNGLLTYCEQYQPAQGNKHLNIHSTFYRTGSLNPAGASSHFGKSEIIDYGFDFYAAQMFADESVLIGWLSMWERNTPYDKYGFSGMLTVPRKLRVENGRLLQEPLFRGEKVKSENGLRITDNANVGVLEIEVKNLRNLTLKLRAAAGEETLVTATAEELIFDRSKSGEPITGKETDELSRAGIRKMPLVRRDVHKIFVVLDLFSVEIFADGMALSSVVCPEITADGISLEADADECNYTRYDVKKFMNAPVNGVSSEVDE